MNLKIVTILAVFLSSSIAFEPAKGADKKNGRATSNAQLERSISLQGDWQRVDVSKVMTISGTVGTFNKKWRGTNSFIKSIVKTGEMEWNCSVINHSTKKGFFWTPCKIKYKQPILSVSSKLSVREFRKVEPIISLNKGKQGYKIVKPNRDYCRVSEAQRVMRIFHSPNPRDKYLWIENEAKKFCSDIGLSVRKTGQSPIAAVATEATCHPEKFIRESGYACRVQAAVMCECN